jgi:branched-chain amino acid transport system permease protein
LERSRRLTAGKPWEENGRIRFSQIVVYTSIIAILVALPLMIPTYLQNMLIKILIFAIFAMSLDLIFGYTGLFSMGHAAFFGVGGYTTGILISRYGIDSFWVTAPLSLIMAVLCAALFGFIAIRFSGFKFLMITYALAQLLFALAWNWFHFTGGAFGLTGIPLPELGIAGFRWSNINFYYFVLFAFVLTFVILNRIVLSPFGYALRGIRESEHRMQALGYNTWLYKYVAFIIAGLFAGLSGMLFAHWNTFISPVQLGVVTSSLGLFYVIIGGAGTLFGPAIGAMIVIILEYVFRIFIPERWPLVLGVLFVLTVAFFSSGVYPYMVKLWKRWLRVNYGSFKSR